MMYLKNTLWLFIVINILSIIIVFMNLYQPQYLSKLIENFTEINNVNFLYIIIFISILALISGLKHYFSRIYSEIIFKNIRENIYKKVLHTSIEKISDFKKGDILSIISNDTRLLKDSLTSITLDLFSSLILLIGSIYFLIKINGKLFVMLLVFLLFSVIISTIYALFIKRYTIQQQEALSSFLTFSEKYLDKILVIKAFWLKNDSEKNFNKTSGEIFKAGITLSKFQSIFFPLNTVFSQLFIIVIIVVFSVHIQEETLSIAEFSKFIMYITFMISPISTIVNSIGILGVAVAAKNRIDSLILNLDNKDTFENITRNIQKIPATHNFINFKDITFKYKNKNIFQNFNMIISLNKLTAIVGKSGAGKTTLINILLKLYSIESGKITIGNEDLDYINLEYLRKKLISYHPQENLEWGETIYESLTLNNNVNIYYLERLIEKLNLKKFIDSLPNGLHTKIGLMTKKASSGELQRLSLIRTLIKESEIYIFDEPTSNLDYNNEIIVNEILKELAKTKTVIVISHRDTILKDVDEIIDLDRKVSL